MINETNVNPMRKLKLIIAIPLLAVLFIPISCSENIEAPLSPNETVADSKIIKDTATDTSNKIKGRVQASETGKGLKNVTVMSLPSREETTTNADGEYILELAKTDTAITFSKDDFQSFVNLSGKKYTVVNVTLRENRND